MTSEQCTHIFQQCILDYHVNDNVDAVFSHLYSSQSIEEILYIKCWIDTVQWHLEDIIRNPDIKPSEALQLKRRIDASNQQRTDKVEQIDDWFLREYSHIISLPEARINTESPAWSIDRLSILELKIYHMQNEVERTDASREHRNKCSDKLTILLEQRTDLSRSINQLLIDIASGNKKMKVYRQMKMYNDAELNPVLYQQNKLAN